MCRSFPRYWAVSAVALTALIACSPQPAITAPEQTPVAEAPAPAPEPVTPATAPEPVAPPVFTPSSSDPGYASAWAEKVDQCADPSRTFVLTGQTLSLVPQSRSCAVTGIDEEHPTGRSMIYHIKAACSPWPPAPGVTPTSTPATVTLTFGASDTVMEMQVDSDPKMTVQRCPPPA